MDSSEFSGEPARCNSVVIEATGRLEHAFVSAAIGRGLTACIRKIVTALNAMLRDNKPWQSSFA
jgi:hypothetical protein